MINDDAGLFASFKPESLAARAGELLVKQLAAEEEGTRRMAKRRQMKQLAKGKFFSPLAKEKKPQTTTMQNKPSQARETRETNQSEEEIKSQFSSYTNDSFLKRRKSGRHLEEAKNNFSLREEAKVVEGQKSLGEPLFFLHSVCSICMLALVLLLLLFTTLASTSELSGEQGTLASKVSSHFEENLEFGKHSAPKEIVRHSSANRQPPAESNCHARSLAATIDQSEEKKVNSSQPVIRAPFPELQLLFHPHDDDEKPPTGSGQTTTFNGVDHFKPRPKRAASSNFQSMANNNNIMAQPPKLVQWAKEPLQYYEGSTLVLSCSLAISQPGGAPALKFTWFKQGKQLSAQAASNQQQQQQQQRVSQFESRLFIETLADYSFLKLQDLRSSDSGAYTCVASNSYGQEDRTSSQVIVNVKLRWAQIDKIYNENNNNSSSSNVGQTNELRVVRAGQSVALECAAAAQPQPRIRWFRLVPVAPPSGRQRNQLSGEGILRQQQQQHSTFGGANQRSASPAYYWDEAHLKSSLLQLELANQQQSSFVQAPSSAPAINFHRIEITTTNQNNKVGVVSAGEQLLLVGNETLNWRVESSVAMHSQHEIHSRLILAKAEPANNGIYECEAQATESLTGINHASNPAGEQQSQQQQQHQVAANGAKQQVAGGDKLERFFGLLVNAPDQLSTHRLRDLVPAPSS